MSIVLTQNNLEIVKKKWKTEGLYRDKSFVSIWAYIEMYFTLIKLMNLFVSASRSVARWKLAGWSQFWQASVLNHLSPESRYQP